MASIDEDDKSREEMTKQKPEAKVKAPRKKRKTAVEKSIESMLGKGARGESAGGFLDVVFFDCSSRGIVKENDVQERR